jgi:hypothetical protein
MRIGRLIALAGSVVLASLLVLALPVKAADTNTSSVRATGDLPVVSLDPNKGTLDGSPVDHLPDNIRLLDIQLPNGGAPMRADWSPDGKRLVFLDAPFGDLWQYDLATGATRNLTESFALHRGVLRAHHLTNGDLVLCALSERSADDPEGDRFRGELWVLQQPLGTRAPVRLGERCWEGIAVSKRPGSTRIAWNQSTIDFTKMPDVLGEALVGESKILTGRIIYRDGRPMIADRTVALDKRDVSLDTPAVEAQDFRSLPDRDANPDDELIFTAYFHKGGQAMGVNLDTGAVTDYSPGSLFYEEAEGIDPSGRYLLVERDLAITFFPDMVDIWRLPLDGSGAFERMTTFDYYRGFGANNPVVSPDGTHMAFGLKVEGEEGEGKGILLMDLSR